MLINDLKDIKNETIEDSQNWDTFMFKEPWDLMEGSISKLDYQKGTPLEDFREKIKDIMDKTGFEYKLSLVGAYATCDGGCYEFAYCLSWYDKSIHQMTFNFETPY